MSKQKKVDVESKLEQTRIELDAWNARVADLDARGTDLKKPLEYSASQVCVTRTKYSLLYDEIYLLKQRLAADIYCDREMEQSLVNEGKDMLRYMDALHANTVKSQYNVRNSFCVSFALRFQGLQTFFKQEVVAVYKYFDESGRVALIML